MTLHLTSRQWILMLCAGWIVLGTTIRANAATLFQSDFERQPDGPAMLKDWNLTGGTFTMEKGWLLIRSQQSNPLAMLKKTHDGDGTFRAVVRNARSCHWVTLAGKGVYRLQIGKEHGGMHLQRLTGKTWKTLAQARDYAQYARNTQEFELRLVFVGRKVFGFLDNKKLIEYEDSEPVPAGGGYGLAGGWGTDLAWRQVQLSTEPDLAEWPYESLPSPAPLDLVEVTAARCGSPDGIYFDGGKAGLKLKLRTARREPTRATLRFRLIDVREKEVAAESRSVTFTPGQEQDLSVDFLPPGRGCFKVAMDAGLNDTDLAWVEDLGSFTVVPRRLFDAPRNDKSYFGGHMDGINLAWHLAVGRKLGIQWARGHNMMQWTWWPRIQPDKPDQWIWNDPAQKKVDDAKLATLGQFLYTPKWAASIKPGKSEAFAHYVFNTVEHHRGSIKHWEVWNEPHVRTFWQGTPEEYAEMLGVAYREAKKADPDCQVLGGGGLDPRNPDWTRRMLAAPGGKSMDAISIHYLEPDLAPTFIPELRRLLESQGVTGPIWNSEESVLTTSFFDQLRRDRLEPEARYHFRNACFELVRTYMENLAGGMQRIFYYEQADPWRFREFPKPRASVSGVSTTMWDEGRMPRPIAAAHAAMALAIEGRTYRMRITTGPLRVFIFEGTNTAVTVQYAAFETFARHETLRLPAPKGRDADRFTVIDFMGNESAPVIKDSHLILPFSREPVYLVCKDTRELEWLKTMYEGAEFPGK